MDIMGKVFFLVDNDLKDLKDNDLKDLGLFLKFIWILICYLGVIKRFVLLGLWNRFVFF